MPLTKILVATDHSDSAQRAEDFAGQLSAPGYTLEIALLYIHPELPLTIGRAGVADVFVPTTALSADDRVTMHKMLSEAASRIRTAAGLNQVTIAEDMVGGSDIAGTIVREAGKSGAQAIVMGSRGRSELAGILLGSTSHKVLQLAHCPVIVVR